VRLFPLARLTVGVLLVPDAGPLYSTTDLLGGGLLNQGGTVSLFGDVVAINRAILGAGVVNL
jgi:hypothetical protein